MIPDGMRDVLPVEAAELRAIEATLTGRFRAYGYEEVRTPALEYAETLEAAGDPARAAGYRLYDDHGRALMLRTEMTAPVARLAASRLRDHRLPLRLSYVAESFRPVASQGGQTGEFVQAGAELLGLEGPEADAECLVVLCDALAAVGLPDARVATGTLAFHRELVAALGLSDEDAADLYEALADRDYPLVEAIAGGAGVSDEGRRSLERALELTGGADALDEARRLASSGGMEAAVDHLVRVHELVDDAGYSDRLSFDFGLLPALDYYTGIVFEAYAPGGGLPLATGGRYDDFVGRFDWPLPAAGLAVDVDRVHQALEDGSGVTRPAPALSFAGGLEDTERAAELRRAGVAVAAYAATARDLPAPSLRLDDGDYVLETAAKTVTRGSWRDVLKALGAR